MNTVTKHFKPWDAQNKVAEWVNQSNFSVKYFPTHEIVAQASEELGEVGRELSHLYGHKKKKNGEVEKDLKTEIGGFLFTLMCLTNSFEIHLMPLRDEYGGSPDKNKWTSDPFRMNTFLVKSLGKNIADKVLLYEQLIEGSDIQLKPRSVLNEIGAGVHEIIEIFEYIIFTQKLSFTLDQAFAAHMEKMYTRDKDRFVKKEGDSPKYFGL